MTASTPGGQDLSATGAGAAPADPRDPEAHDLEQSIGRLLTIGTYVSIALLAVGLGLMLASGIGPLSGGPTFDPSRMAGDLAALHPAGFMWLGLLAVVATPAARVALSLVGFQRRGETAMVVVAALILIVIVVSVALAKALEG